MEIPLLIGIIITQMGEKLGGLEQVWPKTSCYRTWSARKLWKHERQGKSWYLGKKLGLPLRDKTPIVKLINII